VVQCARRTIRVAATRPPSPPGKRCRPGRCPGDCRSNRADMHGVARREGIVRISRTRNAMTAAMDHRPIRPLLIDQPLQKMGQDGRRRHAKKKMIGLSTPAKAALARGEPEARPDHQEQVFIGSPGQDPCRPLDGRGCIARNRLSHAPVELRRARDAIAPFVRPAYATNKFRSR
jgi:hypothetical protein